MSPRLHQVAILGLAGLASLLFLHWFSVQPAPLVLPERDVHLWVGLLFADRTRAGLAFAHLTLILIALTGLAACALAAVLSLRLPDQRPTRRLAWALVCSAASSAYLFFVIPHAQYRMLLGWTPASPLRLACDLVAYSAALLAPLLLVRFFMGYPRVLTAEDVANEALRWRREAREELAASSHWSHRLYPEALRARLTNAEGERHPFKMPSDQQNAEGEVKLFRMMQSRAVVSVLLAWALACALSDWLSAATALGDEPDHDTLFSIARMAFAAMWFIAPVVAWEHVSRCLRIFSRNARPEERRKIDWIKSTLVAGGFLIVGAELLAFLVMPFVIRWLGQNDIFVPAQFLILGPVTIPLQLLALAFVLALAMSIFYRGAVDPRLMARKVSLYGMVATVLAVVFVLIERTVALKIVAAFNLAPDTGAALAFVGVAVTAVPLKQQADKAVNALLGRWLPLDSMIAGERRTLVVALCDLSGYTRLSSEDEKQALLLAALLQRQAANLTKAHGGRIVKSMGDAVLFAFDDATSALRVLADLHHEFPKAAANIGLTVLPVHSGAHIGEVTVAHDGDIYGQTVNIAARIQASAASGQIVVSSALAQCAPALAFEDLGPRTFKNVPEPIACQALLERAPA